MKNRGCKNGFSSTFTSSSCLMAQNLVYISTNHLYGQLIGILLCSSTMFHMRQLLLEKKKQELSEFKAIYMSKDYFPLLFEAMSSGHIWGLLTDSFIVPINCLRKMDVNVIDIRRRPSLIF